MDEAEVRVIVLASHPELEKNPFFHTEAILLTKGDFSKERMHELGRELAEYMYHNACAYFMDGFFSVYTELKNGTRT